MDLNRLLFIAVTKQDAVTVQFLLSRGAKPNANVNIGIDPLQRFNSENSQQMNDLLDSFSSQSATVATRSALENPTDDEHNDAFIIDTDEQSELNGSEGRYTVSNIFGSSLFGKKNKSNVWNPKKLHKAARRSLKFNRTVEEIAEEAIDVTFESEEASAAEEKDTSLSRSKKEGKIRAFFSKIFRRKSRKQSTGESATPDPETLRMRERVMKNMPNSMHQAAATGNVKVIKLLFHYGGDVNNALENVYTPLEIAVLYNHCGAVEELLKLRASVNAHAGSTGKTALYYAVKAGCDEAIVHLLLSHGASPNTRTKDGVTPLHVAVDRKFLAAIELLMEYGCNLNARTEDGVTPLHYAAAKADPDIIEILMRYGAKPASIMKNHRIDISPLRFENDDDKKILAKVLDNYAEKSGPYEMIVAKLIQFWEGEATKNAVV